MADRFCDLDTERVPEDTIARLQPGHARADLDDITGNVRTDDGREGQPGQDDAIQKPRQAVDGVHRDRPCSDNDLALRRVRVRGGARREVRASARQPQCDVLVGHLRPLSLGGLRAASLDHADRAGILDSA